MWEFDNNLNWDLVIRQVYYATLDNSDKVIAPIPSIFVSATSRVLLVGARNNLAPSKWYLAGSVAPRINFSPSSTSQFGGLVQNGYARKIALNKLNLLVIPEYNIYPLFLEVRFAKWHAQMLLEIWQYSGAMGDLTSELNRLESKLDAAVASSANFPPGTTGFF